MLETHLGNLSRGCKLCFKGKKLVLFVTGICPRNCIYCPLSMEKKNNDIINANEVKMPDIKEIIKEAELSGAGGVGITGGEPLAKLERTIRYMRALKKYFGKGFHIHLYTSLNLLNEKNIKQLQKAGLDEIRIHPDIFNKKLWNKISLIKNKFPETTIEIPAIPKKENEILELVDYFKDYVKFFNLNELEYATLYEKEYKQKGWNINSDYSVKGSEKTALNIIKKLKNKKLNIHYCSSQFKDKIQFGNRIKLRAKNTAKPFDKITQEGMLLRAEVIFKNKKELKDILNYLKSKKIDYYVDKKKERVLFNFKYASLVSNFFRGVSIIEQYPTIDGLEVYRGRVS